MNSLADTGTVASLDLEIKRKNIRLEFRNQECVACDNRIALMHKAVYIDNPLVVDSMTNFPGLNIMEYELVRLLNFRQSNPIDGVVESVLNKEKLETIYQTLNSVVSGQIIQKQDGEYYLQEDEQAEPVHFGNLSNGVKAFLIIRMLLEKGLLKEKDVLILDEPEIHLHPEWQTVYAEIIVLLQKYFDLTIVVTTHSPYFMDAINLYSRKHGVAEKTNYYLSEVDDNRVRTKDVTENLEEIYSKMTTPIQILENLRYELDY